MAAQALEVVFHGATLLIVEHSNQPYVPMKPVVSGMGLDWKSQFAKLASNKVRWGMAEITIPTASGPQGMSCLPLRKLPGWLATISPNKVRPELREKIAAYQNEADDVLWAAWQNQNAMHYSVAPGQTLSAEEAQSLRDLLENFAQSMPRDLQAQIMRQGWSKLKAHFKTDYRHIPVARYTEAVSILSRHIAQWAPADPKKKGTLDVSDAPAMMHAREVAQQYFDDYRDAVQSGKALPHMGEIPPEVLEGIIAEAVMRHRLMVHFDRSTGKPVVRLIPHDVCVAPVADWAGIITESDGPRFDDETLVNIASACFGRMAQRAEVRRIGNESLRARPSKSMALPALKGGRA